MKIITLVAVLCVCYRTSESRPGGFMPIRRTFPYQGPPPYLPQPDRPPYLRHHTYFDNDSPPYRYQPYDQPPPQHFLPIIPDDSFNSNFPYSGGPHPNAPPFQHLPPFPIYNTPPRRPQQHSVHVLYNTPDVTNYKQIPTSPYPYRPSYPPPRDTIAIHIGPGPSHLEPYPYQPPNVYQYSTTTPEPTTTTEMTTTQEPETTTEEEIYYTPKYYYTPYRDEKTGSPPMNQGNKQKRPSKNPSSAPVRTKPPKKGQGRTSASERIDSTVPDFNPSSADTVSPITLTTATNQDNEIRTDVTMTTANHDKEIQSSVSTMSTTSSNQDNEIFSDVTTELQRKHRLSEA